MFGGQSSSERIEMHSLGIALKRIDALSDFVGMTARWVGVGMMAAIMTEIILRYFFDSPTIWAHPLCQILWGFYILLGGCYLLRLKTHVRCDFLYVKFSPRKRVIVDVCTHLFFFVWVFLVLVYAVPYAWESLMILERYPGKWTAPKWPTKMVVVIGMSLVLLQGIANYIRDLHLAFTGKELV